MRQIKRKSKIIITGFLILSFLLALCGCSEGSGQGEDQSSSSKTFSVYYQNASADDILYKNYTMQDVSGKSSKEQAEDLLYEMFEADYTQEEYYSALPESVEELGFTITDNVMTVDFSKEYLELSNVQEILLRAAVVLTVIQIEGVNGVSVTVEGDGVKNSQGAEIGVMKAKDFANVLVSDDDLVKQNVTVYYTNEDGSKLVPVTEKYTYSASNTSLEEYIVQKLIEGPSQDSGAYPTISDSVELLSVVTSENVCYVNFGSSFLTQEQPASDEILIYSIVDSICRLSYIKYVQFLIDGENGDMLNLVTDISKPFESDSSLIEDN